MRGSGVAGSRGYFETSQPRNFETAFWSGRRDSNPRPTAWKAVTLPTELLPLTKAEVRRLKSEVPPAPLPSALCLLPFFGGERRIRTSVGRCPADLQSAAFNRSAISPRSQTGAGGRTRTGDLLITNQLLYQLSYASKTSNFQRHDEPVPGKQRTSFDGAAEELRVIAELPNGTQEVTIPSTCAR